MEHKTARLTLLIDPNKKAAFERLCAAQDRTASQVVRQLIRDYLALHGVRSPASAAAGDDSSDKVAPTRASRPQQAASAAPARRTGRRKG
jgi:hypothetical protein